MARPPKGKALTLRPIRLDDDVWAECQRLGKEHGTINEGLRQQLLRPNAVRINISELSGVPSYQLCSECGRVNGHSVTCGKSEETPNFRIRSRNRVAEAKPFKGPLLKPKDRR